MNRFTSTAIAALVALSATAATAANISGPSFTVEGQGGEIVLHSTPVPEANPRPQMQVRAGDVLSERQLMASGRHADDILTISDFGRDGREQTIQSRH